jgi:hypothetical protein
MADKIVTVTNAYEMRVRVGKQKKSDTNQKKKTGWIDWY